MAPSERLAASAASAAILVPSMAIVPREARPAFEHVVSTSTNTARTASVCHARKRAIATWSGTTSAQMARKARSLRHAASMRRDDRTPRQ